MAESDRERASIAWRRGAIDGLPELTIKPESPHQLYTSASEMTIREIGDELQYHGSLVAFVGEELAHLEGKLSYLKDSNKERTGSAMAAFRISDPDTCKLLKNEGQVRAHVIGLDDGDLEESIAEEHRVASMVARLGRTMEAHSIAKETYSRQVAIREMEPK